MLIGGLWHGAAWTFVAWGGIHGAGLALERLVRDRRGERTPSRLRAWIGRIVTFHVVCFAWIFFRSESVGGALDVLAGLLTSSRPPQLVTPLLLATIGLSIASQFVPPDAVTRLQRRFTVLVPAAQIAAVAMALTVIDVLGPDGVAPFIYFRF
jgi:D-alanyl-lipoteichoic acid acyltransferase DltB (MBOAT superfamily)